MGSLFMRLGIFISLSLFLTVAALARVGTDGASHKGGHAPQKGDHAPQKSATVPDRQQLRPQAPIVMGRSVSVHRKTKLHHVKVIPPESIEIHEDSHL
jgi:hypothetical protein